MAHLVIHAGLQPGELLLQSLTAKDRGVVVLPPSQQANRFSVEQLAGPTYSLLRVSAHAWPQASQREALFTFATQEEAQAALVELESALMSTEEPVDKTAPMAAPIPTASSPVFWPWLLASAAVGALAALTVLKSFS